MQIVSTELKGNPNFNRIAVHRVVLAPGERSSTPHAESHEEEFFYVIKGSPDLWLNGFIHNLKEGFAAGFPAGTGIAHAVINNTSEDVHLLVAGERTKKENLCSFPINPEMKEKSPIWWADAPFHKLGPHNGLPGPVKDFERAQTQAECIIDCTKEPRGIPFHYPGDNEKFGDGIRLSTKLGLKALGIWYEYLPSEKRASFPHAHSHEEEFIYVLKGTPKLWLDGNITEMKADEFAAFPSNTGISHTLINDSEEEARYICIGEAINFPEEKILYPMNLLRQQECIRKNCYWNEMLGKQLGPHNGRTKIPPPEHLQFKICTESDANEVLEVFKRSPKYFEKVDGCEPSLQTALNEITSVPATRKEKHFKEFLLVYLDGKSIGALELHANHPEEGICYLGLLIIAEDQFSKGLGTKVYKLAEDYIKRAYACKKIKLGISEQNDVTGYWEKMGFAFNGKIFEWKGENKKSLVKEFDKDI